MVGFHGGAPLVEFGYRKGQILNLRGQAEKESRSENMYDKRVGGWLTWPDVQRCRVKAMQRLAECNASNRRTCLREAAAISLLSQQPALMLHPKYDELNPALVAMLDPEDVAAATSTGSTNSVLIAAASIAVGAVALVASGSF